jgi:hypothetical protein
MFFKNPLPRAALQLMLMLMLLASKVNSKNNSRFMVEKGSRVGVVRRF